MRQNREEVLMVHERGEDAAKTPKDEQRTPPSLFKKLDDKHHYQVDAAATLKNALCKECFTKEMNALKMNWNYRPNNTIWCNPPYGPGQIEPFIDKGFVESLRGVVSTFLIPADISTKWWNTCMLAAEWCRIEGRVVFLHEDGTPIKGSPKFGSMAITFNQKQREAQGNKILVTEMKWRE